MSGDQSEMGGDKSWMGGDLSLIGWTQKWDERRQELEIINEEKNITYNTSDEENLLFNSFFHVVRMVNCNNMDLIYSSVF